jgi:virginiamycin B lyase
LSGNKGFSKHKLNSKIALYVVIGIIILVVAYFVLVIRDKPMEEETTSITTQVENSRKTSIERFQKQFCGIDSKANSNDYVTEILLPGTCEMPLGVVVDATAGKVWYVSTKHGSLGSYDLKNQTFDQERVIPLWASRNNPIDSSQVWTMKIDSSGDIWFTDEKQNSIWKYDKSSDSFQIYKVPVEVESFGSIYPVSLDFDSKGNVYFVGIRSPSLWFGNVTQMSNNTSQGISQIPLPLQGFDGIDRNLISTGSVVVDDENKSVWITVLAFGQKGQILRYDINKQTFTAFDLPSHLRSPVGITLEDSRNLWVTDHGTSIFFSLVSDGGNTSTTEFATSEPSERIFGGKENLPSQAYTLPYWIDKSADGSLWFNEHTGNKIARFLPSNSTLVEYWIPSQNKLFSSCEPQSLEACGLANALQLDVDDRILGETADGFSNLTGHQKSEVWFTEWSENKIARVNTSHPLPFSVSTSPQEITIRKGESASVDIFLTPSHSMTVDAVNMTASATFMPTGDFGNSTWSFSEESISLNDGKTKTVKFIISPSPDLSAGRYTLMLGAQDPSVTILKALPVNII